MFKKIVIALLFVIVSAINLSATSDLGMYYNKGNQFIGIYPTDGSTTINENDQDWVAVYPQGASNDWGNVIQWAWVKDLSSYAFVDGGVTKYTKMFDDEGLDQSSYEVRYFLNNTFDTYKSHSFDIGIGLESIYVYTDNPRVTLQFNDGATPNIDVNTGDWIAIFQKGSPNEAAHVVEWIRVSDGVINNGWAYPTNNLENGVTYEVRYFLDNSYVPYMTSGEFEVNGVYVEITNQTSSKLYVNSTHENDQENYTWIGIYKVGDSNDWENVKSWSWVTQDNTELDIGNLGEGTYEARLFYNNSFDLEYEISFEVVYHDYVNLGDYNVSRHPAVGLENDYVVYYPEGGISADMPVVLFLEGGGEGIHIDDYKGVMKFMASKGYFVIGSEGGGDYNSSLSKNIFEDAINTAKGAYGLTISKLAVMGHSQGGGQAFYVMKYFRDQGYGDDASLLLSIDGWFAFNMLQATMGELDMKIAFIQMNGLDGAGTDPRVHLSIWNLADNSEKSFFTLPQNEHLYLIGTLDEILQKQDQLYIISALTDDVFTGSNTGEQSIPTGNKADYIDIFNELDEPEEYPFDCAGQEANASGYFELYNNDINYCDPDIYQ